MLYMRGILIRHLHQQNKENSCPALSAVYGIRPHCLKMPDRYRPHIELVYGTKTIMYELHPRTAESI